jgi:hypothetical protein
MFILGQFLFKFVKIFADKKIKVPAVVLSPYVNFSKAPRDGIPRGHHLIFKPCIILMPQVIRHI